MKKQVLFRNFFLFFGPLEKNNGRESVGKDKKRRQIACRRLRRESIESVCSASCVLLAQGFEQFGETHFRAANGTVASGAVDAFCPDGSFAGGALTHMSAVHRKSVGRQIGALSHSSGAEPGRG
ncbi:hypothetical protein [uncultured Victivallis sp.]|uniref:hypothetical protein n=1 Tax=uncultured Victivallis sp. TaxID=354118 RepID=UPI0025DA0FB5|nr:hypothetical protein [uncultured Victivallis sp.]